MAHCYCERKKINIWFWALAVFLFQRGSPCQACDLQEVQRAVLGVVALWLATRIVHNLESGVSSLFIVVHVVSSYTMSQVHDVVRNDVLWCAMLWWAQVWLSMVLWVPEGSLAGFVWVHF